jgi:hypothetical protein
MRKTTLVIAIAVLGAARVAAADGDGGKSEVGLDLALLPSGSFHSVVPVLGTAVSTSTSTAFGIGATIGARSSLVFVDLAPRMLFDVNYNNSNMAASKELDLRARIGVVFSPVPRISIRGYGAPGYSMIFPAANTDTSKGFSIGAGGMVGFEIVSGAELTVDVGYTWGMEKVTVNNVIGSGTTDIDAATDYLHLGVGIMFTH